MSNKRLPKYLGENEIKLLWEKMKDKRSDLMVKVGYYLGLRVSELVGLTWEDIDLPKNKALIRWENAKGSKERVVVIPTPLMKELVLWKQIDANTGRLFNMSPSTAWRRIKQAAKDAGLPDWVSPHTLRHSFATHFLKKSRRLEVVQDCLGHASIATTRIYAKVCLEDREDETKKVWG